MGLFRPRSKTERPTTTRQVSAIDPDRAREIVLRLVDSQAEGDAAARAAMRALSEISGLPLDLLEQAKRLSSEPDLFHRPWRWLTSAAEQALREGDPITAARAYAFIALFVRQIAPHMTMLDAQETGLTKPDPHCVQALAQVAAGALEALPEGEIVVPSAGLPREAIMVLLREDLPRDA